MKVLRRMSVEELKQLKRRIRYMWRTRVTDDRFEKLFDKANAELKRREARK